MRDEAKRLLERILSADLLSSCGKAAPIGTNWVVISSWDEAATRCGSIDWENNGLAVQNHRQRSVHNVDLTRMSAWNPTARAARQAIVAKIDTAIAAADVPEVCRRTIAGDIGWHLLGAVLEEEFADIVRPSFDQPVLLPIYLAGRLPCGWSGPGLPEIWDGVLPRYTLFVY